ncbi:MAG: LysM peptidoglycan-binding domain-containing protein [Bacteroidales bacterium]|nr:LysM peptidoglycan-binding domain-containing protein [Bacteroidales bacterium]
MRRLLFISMLFILGTVLAQGNQTSSIRLSSQTQRINNKEYYVHIVEQGQTLFSIARAYGLKYYDAVIKTDIHLMKVGDTVWLPKNEYSVAAISAKASAATSSTTQVHYIKVEPGQTLYGISREYGVTVDQIIEANPELKDQQLQAGQMLKIPPKTTPKSTPQPTTQPQQKTEPAPQKPEPQQKPESSQPTQPTQPTQPSKPTQPTQPTQPTPSDSAAAPLRRPIQNPYPFDEIPAGFPSSQAPYFNFSTQSSFNFQVRERQDKNKVFVTIVMPLNLDKLNEISTSKFDIEQRGKKEYKVFEFIQFYEGILIALEQLQNRGVSVVLNVVDLSSDKDEDVVAAFNSHQMANSDFIVALLVKKPFDKLSQLAKEHQVFVINPFSSRSAVVENNPYIVKCMPSVEGTVHGVLDMVASRHKGCQLYLIHSNNKSNSTDERLYREEFVRQLDSRKDIKYTLFDWSANGKLLSTLKTTKKNVIISLYDQNSSKNMVYVTTLLNRLSSLNTDIPTLFSLTNFINDYPDIDYSQLQHLNYSMVTLGYLNYDNYKHKSFIDTYKTKFLTEPNTLYAGVAHDIMIYFCSALWQQGAEFWRNPQQFNSPQEMLFPFSLKQRSATSGYENQSPDIYRMSNYKLVK